MHTSTEQLLHTWSTTVLVMVLHMVVGLEPQAVLQTGLVVV